MTDAERRAKNTEQVRKWRQAHRFEIAEKRRLECQKKKDQKQAELLIQPPKTSYAEFDSEPSTEAAIVNQKYQYALIIGEYHNQRRAKHCILEKLHDADGRPFFRVKTTVYYAFTSESAAAKWCRENKMQLSASRYR